MRLEVFGIFLRNTVLEKSIFYGGTPLTPLKPLWRFLDSWTGEPPCSGAGCGRHKMPLTDRGENSQTKIFLDKTAPRAVLSKKILVWLFSPRSVSGILCQAVIRSCSNFAILVQLVEAVSSIRAAFQQRFLRMP